MVTERGGRGLSKPWFAVLLFCVGMCWTVSGKESPRPQTILLSSLIRNGRIVLLWSPANQHPSDGVKIARAIAPDFSQESIDQYTKWLPGTGYTQCVLFPSASSAECFYYRVSFVETGKKAQTLALSNVVKVEPPRNANEEENAEAEDEE